MQPSSLSSLVFLVIIAVWAAYFVQYWVRRREHLATARSVDQFSESMRVLERRSPLPASNLSTPQPRSYAVTPARAARPQVLVKRAETASAFGETAGAGEGGPGPQDRRQVRPTHPTSGGSARRGRAIVMLGALSTVLVAVPLVALSMLPLYALVVPAVSAPVAVAWARATVRADHRRRATELRSRGAEHRDRVAPAPVVSERRQRVEPSERVEPVDGLDATEAAPIDGQTTPAVRQPRDELFDVQAVEVLRHDPARGLAAPAAATAVQDSVPAMPARPLVDEDDIPLTWDPVPVPRPTYTMKARVTRPAPTSADLVGDADTEYAAYQETSERRVAGA